MTLEGDDDAALTGDLACRAQCHLHLRRVVRVVVVDADAVDLAAQLEAPLRAGECLESFRSLGHGSAEHRDDRPRGGRIEGVVHAGHLQRHRAAAHAMVHHAEGPSAVARDRIDDAHIGIR